MAADQYRVVHDIINNDADAAHGPLLGRCAMNAGEGPKSYVRNSSYQRGVVDTAMSIIEEEVSKKLDIKQISKNTANCFCVADFGCSTGHNSFPAVEKIIGALVKKLLKENKFLTSIKFPEFFVFFNDVYTNDFNTLFQSLPPKRKYHAIAAPGDFHGRLLPNNSLMFAYSSWSLQWLTEIPKAIADATSPAWNRGAILYARDRKKVCEAYLDQYMKEIHSFLNARAQELVAGGLMALLIPAVPSFWDPNTDYTIPEDINLLGSCLMDMAKMGRFSEEKVDSFNLPYYFTTPEELKTILKGSRNFTTERLEILGNLSGKNTVPTPKARATFYRAVHERLLTSNFGSEIVDELFERYAKKLADSPVFLNPENDKTIVILAILKREAILIEEECY